MMRSKSLLMLLAAAFLLCLPGLSVRAQNRTLRVQGVVSDTKGEPLAGVMVYVQGTSNGSMTGSNGRYFARHSWQQSGQCCTSSGRVKVFPQYLQVLVIIPGAACARPPAANSLLNQSSSTALPPPSRLQIRFFNMSAASSSMWIAASRTAVISS